MSEMKIKALAPWFGSKRNLALEIVAEMGPHRAYWEPFCGSMAVLLAKPRASHETVADLNGDLVNLAAVIKDPVLGPKLYRRLRRAVMTETLLNEAKAKANDDPLDRAEAFWVKSWVGRNGTAGTLDYNAHLCVRWTPTGGHGGIRFQNAVMSIPAFRRRLRDVLVLERDAFEVIPRIDDAVGVMIYVDAPYVSKAARYVHDDDVRPVPVDDDEWKTARSWAGVHAPTLNPARAAWHKCLADRLQRFQQARVIVSYYDHPMLDELYVGWTKRCFEVSKAMAHQGKRGECDTRATEVLFINGPSLVERRADRSLFAEASQ